MARNRAGHKDKDSDGDQLENDESEIPGVMASTGPAAGDGETHHPSESQTSAKCVGNAGSMSPGEEVRHTEKADAAEGDDDDDDGATSSAAAFALLVGYLA